MNFDKDTLENEGRVWARNTLTQADIQILKQACISKIKHGTRIHWNSEQAKSIANIRTLQTLVESILPSAHPVRALVFNKSKGTNWVVPWHQDRVIAVKQKHTIDDYKNWTQKSGIWHVEPPVHILERMVFARIHLEDSDAEGGSMEIALKSHKQGYIPANTVPRIIQSAKTELCLAKAGDILILKALTLHRSRSSTSTSSRQTLRVDYSNQALPVPLQWANLD